MTTHKIDPALVSDVLGIEQKLKEMECDCGMEIDILDTSICIRGCDHIADSGFNIDGMHEGEDGDYYIDIHRFKDMAIEWMAKRNYIIERVAGCVVAKRNWEILEEFIYGGSKPDYPNMLSAELAAIDFAWEQIQKEKKDEND